METATDIINLLEKYYSRVKGWKGGPSFTVFGPTVDAKDFAEIKRSVDIHVIRFIAYAPGKKLWVWAAANGIHSSVFETIPEFKGKDLLELARINQILVGVAYEGSKWEMNGNDVVRGRNQRNFDYFPDVDTEELIKNFKWLDRQINVSKWLKANMRKG